MSGPAQAAHRKPAISLALQPLDAIEESVSHVALLRDRRRDADEGLSGTRHVAREELGAKLIPLRETLGEKQGAREP